VESCEPHAYILAGNGKLNFVWRVVMAEKIPDEFSGIA
jgi:hypothetical protein